MITYKITMDDGKRVDLPSNNAAQAIQKALEQFPGRKVVDCYSGFRENHIAVTNSGSMERGPEWIDYEIPKHDALPVNWRDRDEEPWSETEAFGFLETTPVRKLNKAKKKVKAKV